MKSDFLVELEVAKSTARRVGEIQQGHFRKDLKVIRKTPKEFVSNVDIECQNLSHRLLTEKFPYPVLSEEKRLSENIDSNLFWVVDPVDGTHNFIAGVPNFGVSIALLSKHEFVLGVIHLPYFDEMYYAVKGNGAFMNGKPIAVSDNKVLEKSMITYDNQFYLSKYSFERYKRLVDHSFTTRIFGSAVYDFGLIASGIIDARVWNNTKIFDFAAGVTLVREAGGMVTDFNGDNISTDSKELVASNGSVHSQLVDLLKEV
ncbi:MAG: inositol monophosphatase [Candidatus Altiarchaeota archaeon]